MALEFIADDGVFNENTNRVPFFALDAGVSVMFAITREALEDLAGKETLSPTELTEAFQTNRDRIEAIAEKIYAAQANRSIGAYVIGPNHLGRL